MGKIQNDEQRKIKNEHFIRAFEYVAKMLNMTQGQLAKEIGSKNAYISNFRKGLRPIPEETINGLLKVSSQNPSIQIFREYLYGNSEIMLLTNVSEKEVSAANIRKNNPDYEAMQKEKAASTYNEVPSANIPNMCSVFNAVLAAKDEAYAALQLVLESKEETIKSLHDQIAAKDQLIAEQKALLIDYRRIIDTQQSSLSNYPFPVGSKSN